MKQNDLWKRYCRFYEKDFSEQLRHNKRQLDRCFHRWKKTDLAKTLCQDKPVSFRDAPITTYSDYSVLREFGHEMVNTLRKNPRKPGEIFREYYDRIGYEIGSSLNRYMTEPYYLCMRSTGTAGESKWVAHGGTFWRNFSSAAIASAIVACSDGWGETKLRVGDRAINVTAPIPYISGWGSWASQTHLELVPPIEVTDNLLDMKQMFNLLLKAIRKGEKISLGGGLGSMFYMICKYFVDPESFYSEYLSSMNLGLRKFLLTIKLLEYKISRKERRRIIDLMPLKGVLIGGMESQLYIDFFKEEFDLEPLHAYGSTEGGNLMRGDPDRKTDLVPDLRTGYFEFETENGEIGCLDELKRGEVYSLVVTPFGSVIFRYNMGDLFRVVDFRDDNMPIFSFEGRRTMVIDLYSYRVYPNVIISSLSKAGLKSSDKWVVAKVLKPRERLHFLMEKTWEHSEREAERIIFNHIMKTERSAKETTHRDDTLLDYARDFRIKKPSEMIRVEYLRPGTFLRYTMKRAKMGIPIGQLKPPTIIPPEKTEIYDTLRSA